MPRRCLQFPAELRRRWKTCRARYSVTSVKFLANRSSNKSLPARTNRSPTSARNLPYVYTHTSRNIAPFPLYGHRWAIKITPFYFYSNVVKVVKPSSILIIFGMQTPTRICNLQQSSIRIAHFSLHCEQGRNFGLKSGDTNSEGERGALWSRDERGGKWEGGMGVRGSLGRKRFYSNPISADRFCWQ